MYTSGTKVSASYHFTDNDVLAMGNLVICELVTLVPVPLMLFSLVKFLRNFGSAREGTG